MNVYVGRRGVESRDNCLELGAVNSLRDASDGKGRAESAFGAPRDPAARAAENWNGWISTATIRVARYVAIDDDCIWIVCVRTLDHVGCCVWVGDNQEMVINFVIFREDKATFEALWPYAWIADPVWACVLREVP